MATILGRLVIRRLWLIQILIWYQWFLFGNKFGQGLYTTRVRNFKLGVYQHTNFTTRHASRLINFAQQKIISSWPTFAVFCCLSFLQGCASCCLIKECCRHSLPQNKSSFENYLIKSCKKENRKWILLFYFLCID